ncbi:MAG: hydroxyacylglutathione hydrolase [Gammaproteobacteria bacterium]|nr:hydroxyacylglutathione hydrolase [Gammaproteobacteria bacterium]
MLYIEPIPAFDDNYIWLILDNERRYAAIVDPGDEEPVIDYLQQHQIQPVAILITHHHGDHTGGIQELVAQYKIPVYGPAHEHIPAMTHPLKEGDQVTLKELAAEFRIIDAPGHTHGHILYYGHGQLFCGDTLFAGGCGRVFEGTMEQMYQAMEKIEALPDQTLVYCAHEYTEANLRFAQVAEPDNGPLLQRIKDTQALRKQNKATVPSLLSLEKQTNPFLRCRVESLILTAEEYARKPLTNPAQVFATVRRWKDSLD